MVLWWNALTLIEQVFAIIAIPATVLLVIQTVLLLFSAFGEGDSDMAQGHGHASDFSHDHEHDLSLDDAEGVGGDGHAHDSHQADHAVHDPGLRIFTVRGIVAFFCIFGWSGLVMLRNNVVPPVSIAVAIALGFLFMLLIAYAFWKFMGLQSDGTIDVNRAVGVMGTVYIPIPKSREGAGKVMVLVSGRLTEFDAITDDGENIPTQSEIRVTSVTKASTLVVKRHNVMSAMEEDQERLMPN